MTVLVLVVLVLCEGILFRVCIRVRFVRATVEQRERCGERVSRSVCS